MSNVFSAAAQNQTRVAEKAESSDSLPELTEADIRNNKALDRGELTEDMLKLARQYAGWAFRQGWGDRDDLESAATYAAWKSVEVWQRKGDGQIRWWRPWVAYFVRMRLMSMRKEFYRKARCRTRWGSAVYVGSKDDVGAIIEDRRSASPEYRAERAEFWQDALKDLTDKQKAAAEMVYRDGLGYTDAGRKLDLHGNNVEDSLGWALSKIVKNLAPHRETMPFPKGKKAGPPAGLGDLYIDGLTWRRCFEALPERLQKACRREGTDLRNVFSAMRYIWQTGCSLKGIQNQNGAFPTYSLIDSWQKKLIEAGVIDELREILAPAESHSMAA